MPTAPTDRKTKAEDRNAVLVGQNLTWLRQAADLLERVDDVTYSSAPPALPQHKAGSHLRHILEFFECFLDGVESLHVDYDARRRDQQVERSRAAALARIHNIMLRLQSTPALHSDGVLFVRAEDADSLGLADPFTISSVSRELVVLSSHTIHHFALLAVTLQMHGFQVHGDFGVAPSTLTYRSGLQATQPLEAA